MTVRLGSTVIKLFVFFFRRKAKSTHKVSSDDETTSEQSMMRCWMSVLQSDSSRPLKLNGLNQLSRRGHIFHHAVKCILFNKLLNSVLPCQGILPHVMDV